MPIGSKRKRRVAGYARVSTDHEDQVTSYEAQVDYYTNYIKGRDDWEFVAIYTDEGISATNTKRREGFKAMVADALAGKIDLIVTKSVSRFARNTVDSLTTVRTLKEKGVEIYFEKENIWTLDAKGELLITIMSSLAQEESRSISENTTWGQRKRFADGKASVAYKRFLGYDRGPERRLCGQSGAGKDRQADLQVISGWPDLPRHRKGADGAETADSGRQGSLEPNAPSAASLPMRNTKATPSCRRSSQWTSYRRKQKRMRVKYRSIMWRATTRLSSIR